MTKTIFLFSILLLSACSTAPTNKSSDDSDQEKENKKIERMFFVEPRGARN